MLRTARLLEQLHACEPVDSLEAGHRVAMVLTVAHSRGRAVSRRPGPAAQPVHDHFDVRYLARTSHPDSIIIDRGESNDLAWVALDRAAVLMPGAESQRVIRKIESLLRAGGRASRPSAPGILPGASEEPRSGEMPDRGGRDARPPYGRSSQ